jgi:hypothetical protein
LDSSLLAPGLAADVAVCFTPDSRADYTDSLVVDSPGGRFEVPLLGRRRHPKLTLPAVLQVRIHRLHTLAAHCSGSTSSCSGRVP